MYIGPSFDSKLCRKGRPHGHRYGKTTEQRDCHIAHLKDSEFRASQLEHCRTEEVCIQMDELAQNDFSYHMAQAEYFR